MLEQRSVIEVIQITDNRVPFGIRLALEERFTDCLGCQISDTDMTTDILSYVLEVFDDIEDPEGEKKRWSPDEVMLQVGWYLAEVSKNCKHAAHYSGAMARAISKLGAQLHADVKLAQILSQKRMH